MAITSKMMGVGIVPQDRTLYIPAASSSIPSVTSAVSLDGITYGTGATITSTNLRYTYLSHPDASDSFAIVPIILPDTYVSGTNISITVIWTSTATSGNVRYNIGVTHISSTGTYTGDTDNDVNYAGIASYSAPTTIQSVKKETVTISGTGLVAGGVINILSARNGIAVADNMTAAMFILGFLLKYKVNAYGE